MPPRHVLVAVDFSPLAEAALSRALALAAHHGAKVTLAYVEPELGAEAAGAAPVFPGDVAAQVRAAEADLLEACLARARAIVPEAVAVRRPGRADELVPVLAAEVGADLIVLGTHGRSGVRRFLLGSVAERVARRAPCAVLVVRGERGAGDDAAVFRVPVVATDFSPCSDAAVVAADALAAPGVPLEVVHAWDYPVGSWGLSAIGLATRAAATLREAIVAGAEAQGAAQLARHAGLGRPVTFALVEGATADALTAHAAARGADLIAIGSHGHRGLHRLLLGSVAEATLRHAPCSVLIARP